MDSKRFLAGDPRVVQQVRRAIEIAVQRYCAQGSAREELAQEALGRVYLGLESGRFRGDAKLTTYAENVAKFTCFEHGRQRGRTEPLPPTEPPATTDWGNPDALMDRGEKHARNFRAFAALPRECRELFVSVFVDEMTYADLAQKHGVSESTIRCRIHRCRIKACKLRE